MNDDGFIGYVYLIRERSSGLSYVGFHAKPYFDKKYFGSPMSKTGLRALYISHWPQSNKLGFAIPSFEAFSLYFEMSVLEWCSSKDELHLRERFWIDELDSYENGLNRSRGAGSGSVYGSSYEKHCDVCEKLTKWKGSECYNCLHIGLRSRSYCDSCDAETTHIGQSCVSCSLLAATKFIFCESCDRETKHRSGVCQRCVVVGNLRQENCAQHGLTMFSGNACRKCITGSGTISFCESCRKLTSHMFNNCMNCSAQNSVSLKECTEHGETAHKGDTCCTCVSQRSQSRRFCDVCQEEKPHRGDNCMSCSYLKTIEILNCAFCEKDTKHQKGTCLTCRPRHRKHKDQFDSSCSLCALSLTN